MKNKILIGLVWGIVLGFFDGATAWFTPEARAGIAGILMGSSFKGMVVGILCGWFARKVHSKAWGIALGSALGLLFAYLVASAAVVGGRHPYLEIMFPGFVVGAIVGFLTQTMGVAPAQRERA